MVASSHTADAHGAFDAAEAGSAFDGVGEAMREYVQAEYRGKRGEGSAGESDAVDTAPDRETAAESLADEPSTDGLSAESSSAESLSAESSSAESLSAESSSADDGPRGWVAELLESSGGARACARRVAFGIALSGLYGLAMGMRKGGRVLFESALGVALAPLAVLVLAIPAMHILLAVLDVSIEPQQLMRGAARGTAATGLALAGLAPAAALFVVTSEEDGVAVVLAGAGLLVAGMFGLLHLRETYVVAMRDVPPSRRFMGNMVFACFAVFSIVLALRLWWPTVELLLPMGESVAVGVGDMGRALQGGVS